MSRRRGRQPHLSITGHVEEMREDTDLADIDRLGQEYMGKPCPQRDRRRISAWIAVDGWPGCTRQARPNDCLPRPDQPEPDVLRAAQGSSDAIADRTESAPMGCYVGRSPWLRAAIGPGTYSCVLGM